MTRDRSHGGPAPIAVAIDEWRRTADLRPLAQRLADRYGHGARPDLAAAWYRAVEGTCTGDGPAADAAWDTLRRCAERAADADDPQRYVCAAVSRALRAAGIWPAAGRATRDRAAS